MKAFSHIYIISLFLLLGTTLFSSCSVNNDKPIDVKEAVLGHMSDTYDWHITTIGEKHISIPSLCIVKHHEGSWAFFSSAHLTHLREGETYDGFYIDHTRQGKIYERGYETRPWDISITKNVIQIWINIVILLLIFLPAAHWYKKQGDHIKVPRGAVGALEMLVMSIYDDVIKPAVGEKHYRKFAPYLLTVFFFIFVTNLLGLIPIFPGGANVTGNITITLILAVMTFLITNLSGNKEYWKEVFWPEVPIWMKVPLPIMPVIEFFGVLTKPFALMVRLFANIMGGHAIILSLVCVIFITNQVNAVVGTSLSAMSLVLIIFMNFLELLVAFIQAYVFTMLSAVFIGLSHPEHEHH